MTAIAVMYGGMPDAIVAQVKHMPPLVELHGEADRNVPLASGGELVNLAIGELGVPVLFTEAARFQSWLDVERPWPSRSSFSPKCRIRASTECELAYVFADR